jgi:hypothetical protein
MHFAHSARKVLLDTSAFRRFLDVDLFLELHGYLGKKAFVVEEVMAELCDVAGYRRHAALKMTLTANPSWPQVIPPQPLDVEEEILRIQTEKRPAERSGDEKVNLGEIATVVVGAHLNFPLIVADDGLAKLLAKPRGLPRISTAMLAVEMLLQGALDEAQGFAVYDCATPTGIGRLEFEAAVQRAQDASP